MADTKLVESEQQRSIRLTAEYWAPRRALMAEVNERLPVFTKIAPVFTLADALRVSREGGEGHDCLSQACRQRILHSYYNPARPDLTTYEPQPGDALLPVVTYHKRTARNYAWYGLEGPLGGFGSLNVSTVNDAFIGVARAHAEDMKLRVASALCLRDDKKKNAALDALGAEIGDMLTLIHSAGRNAERCGRESRHAYDLTPAQKEAVDDGLNTLKQAADSFPEKWRAPLEAGRETTRATLLHDIDKVKTEMQTIYDQQDQAREFDEILEKWRSEGPPAQAALPLSPPLSVSAVAPHLPAPAILPPARGKAGRHG